MAKKHARDVLRGNKPLPGAPQITPGDDDDPETSATGPLNDLDVLGLPEEIRGLSCDPRQHRRCPDPGCHERSEIDLHNQRCLQ